MENVAVNETLVDNALRVSINQSAGEVVEEALRFFVAQKQQAQIRDFRGKLHWEGDIDAMLLSQAALAKNWDTAEEDAAWADL